MRLYAGHFQCSGIALSLLDYKVGRISDIGEGEVIYKKYTDVFTMFSFFGLSLISGLSFTLLFWEKGPVYLKVEIIYWILLALALPMSVLNYWSADTYISRSQQADVNAILLFLGAVCLVHLISISTSSVSSKVLKVITVFFLAFQGLLVPAIYTVLWRLNWQNAIFLADTNSLSPGWISSASGIGALIYRYYSTE